MKKLVVKVFKATAEDATRLQDKIAKDGEFEYAYFVDPDTGKFYRPCEGFTVESEAFDEGFVEVT